MSKTLKQAQIGETVTVQRLQGEGPVKRRIMDMGITKGTSIYVRKVAPLGDPVEITVRGYELSLRKQVPELILVQYPGPLLGDIPIACGRAFSTPPCSRIPGQARALYCAAGGVWFTC